MHFGATLRLLRVDAGLSLRALAEGIGVSSAYLSRVENGHDAPPTPDRLVAIANALGFSPALLVGLADRVSPFVSDYLARVPTAGALFFEIARRELTTAQLARVHAFIDEEFPVHERSTQAAPRVGPLIARGGVVTEMTCSQLDDVLDIASARLARATGSSAAQLSRALRHREQDASTAIGAGVAVPHAIVDGVEPAAVLVTLKRPLAFPTPDGLPLRVCIGVVHPPEHSRLLALLAHIAGLARDDFADQLCGARDPRRALALLE